MKKIFTNKILILSLFILVTFGVFTKNVNAADDYWYQDESGTIVGPYADIIKCNEDLVRREGNDPVKKSCYKANGGSGTGAINKTTYTLLTKGFPGIKGGCIDASGNDTSCENGVLAPFLNSLVKIAIAIAAVLAIIMLVIRGIQYMGDESVFGHTEAKDGMWKAILGLIIALASYAILNTIDPALLGRGGLNVPTVSADIEEESEPFYEYQQPGIGTKVSGCTGGTVDVRIPWGSPSVISTCKDISTKLADMLTAAYKDGHKISGASFRSIESQIALRRKNNCPDIYNSPSSACRPPTARPGHSMHERGLAIDLNCNGGSMGGSACFTWLKQNASKYGFYNLKSEPWHWSTTGQ